MSSLLNYEVYTTNPLASAFHHQEFEPTVEFGYEVLYDALWIIVPGVLAVIFLIFWSCWTTECWPLKRRSPCVPVLGSTSACLRRRQHKDGSSQCISKTALVLALLGTGLCAFGLYADSEQTYVLDDGLPSELEQIITLEDQALALTSEISSTVEAIGAFAGVAGNNLAGGVSSLINAINVLENPDANTTQKTSILERFGVNSTNETAFVQRGKELEKAILGLASSVTSGYNAVKEAKAALKVTCDAVPNAALSTAPEVIQSLLQLPGVASVQLDCAVESIHSKIDKADVPVDRYAAQVNDWRSPITIALLAVLMVYGVYRTIIIFKNLTSGLNSRIHALLFTTTPLRNAGFLILLFVTVIYSAVSYGLAVGAASVCVEPDATTLRLINQYAHTGDNDFITYYVTCGSNPDAESPITENLGTISTVLQSLNYINLALNLTQTACSGSGVLEQLQGVCSSLHPVASTVTRVNELVGWDPTTDSPSYAPGSLFTLTSCGTANGRYEGALVLVCDRLLSSSVWLFFVLLLLVIIMIIGDILSRLTPHASFQTKQGYSLHENDCTGDDVFSTKQSLQRGFLSDYDSVYGDAGL